MTWKSAVMPDDALTDCLVGTMLQGTTDKSSAVELSGNPGELPLWQVLIQAHAEAFQRRNSGLQQAKAAEIEALRDWLFFRTCHTTHALEVRDLLTKQARIAKGES